MGYYHEKEMKDVRSTINNDTCIVYEKVSDNDCDGLVKRDLAHFKSELMAKWLFNYRHGVTFSIAQNFSGRMSVANAWTLMLSLYGIGFLNNSLVRNPTYLNGSFMISNSRLKNKLSIGSSTVFISCDNCLLGKVEVDGAIILDLKNTIVDGDIVFARQGFVVIDEKSIITGSVVNGTVIKG